MKCFVTIFLLNCLAAFAQPVSGTTNIITSPPSFRIVNGQLYNTDLSTNFATLRGICVAVLSNGVIVQRINIRQTYQEVATNTAQAIAALGGAPAPVLKEEVVPGKKFFIRNYPDRPLAVVGSPVKARAMRDGIFSYESEIMELWDYGTPNQIAVVTTNGVSTNVVKAGVVKKP